MGRIHLYLPVPISVPVGVLCHLPGSLFLHLSNRDAHSTPSPYSGKSQGLMWKVCTSVCILSCGRAALLCTLAPPMTPPPAT